MEAKISEGQRREGELGQEGLKVAQEVETIVEECKQEEAVFTNLQSQVQQARAGEAPQAPITAGTDTVHSQQLEQKIAAL